jgi:hypothetical protein
MCWLFFWGIRTPPCFIKTTILCNDRQEFVPFVRDAVADVRDSSLKSIQSTPMPAAIGRLQDVADILRSGII